MSKIHGQATFVRFVYKQARRLAQASVESGVTPKDLADAKFVEILKESLKALGLVIPSKFK